MLVELSHCIEQGMQTYPGLPGPKICDYWQRESHGGFHVARVDMVVNTGTFLDAPFHRYPDGADVSELPLQITTALPGVCVTANPGPREIGRERFENVSVRGRAVLVFTGWDSRWGSEDYAQPNPHLDIAAARYLRDAGAKLVGIDSINIDDRSGQYRPVHDCLLAAGIPIVEHLTGLQQLSHSGFKFFAAPVRVKGVGSFPVRAYAEVT